MPVTNIKKTVLPILLVISGLLCSPVTYGEIYKCVVNGKTTFSDKSCGDSAKVVTIEQQVPSSKRETELTTQKIKEVTKTLSEDRQKRELDSRIKRYKGDIEDLKQNFNDKMAKLEEDLAEARTQYERTWNYKGSRYKRDEYYARKKALENEISDTRRRHYTELNTMERELSDMKRTRRKMK